MNLKEAYEKMREGKKVKRKGRSMCCVYDSKENTVNIYHVLNLTNMKTDNFIVLKKEG